MFFDVAAETIDDARALFDEKKRAQVRARARARGQGLFSPISPLPTMQAFQPYPRVGGPTTSPIPTGPPAPFADSRYGSAIREAEGDHREIHRQLLNMPSDEREQIPEVATSADAVFRKVQQLALSLSDLDRSAGRETSESVEKEITTLESQANPLDYRASEESEPVKPMAAADTASISQSGNVTRVNVAHHEPPRTPGGCSRTRP